MPPTITMVAEILTIQERELTTTRLETVQEYKMPIPEPVLTTIPQEIVATRRQILTTTLEHRHKAIPPEITITIPLHEVIRTTAVTRPQQDQPAQVAVLQEAAAEDQAVEDAKKLK